MPSSSSLVSPEEVMASDPAEAKAHLDAEIRRVEEELAPLKRAILAREELPEAGRERAEALLEKLADLRIQRAQLNPVEPADEGEEP